MAQDASNRLRSMTSEKVMEFIPINDDHAIQAVKFTVVFDRPLSSETVAELRLQHRLWRRDLPAMSVPQAFEFEVDAISARPRSVTANGVEFSYLRPDGSPAWVLRFLGPELNVECSRYTRWAQVWEQAQGYICKGLNVVGRAEPRKQVQLLGLTVVDRFKAQNDSYDLRALLSDSKYVHKAAFEAGPTWHSHFGWFEYSRDHFTLNNLNVDARKEPYPDSGAGEPGDIYIIVTHTQQRRYKAPIQNLGDAAGPTAWLTADMDDMHHKNKSVMSELLTKSVKQRIGLEDRDELL